MADLADNAGVHRAVADDQHILSFRQQRVHAFPQEVAGAGEQVVQAFSAAGW